MLKLCLTFDYELFLGENYGTDKEILIDPTNAIISCLDKWGIKGTFFVDTCCLHRYKELKKEVCCEMWSKQLKAVYNDGHDLELHIHPNWSTSNYDGENWLVDDTRYSLKDYPDQIQEIILEGIELLKDVTGDDKYQCVAYRAGGFAIEPLRETVNALIACGVSVDSSVALYSEQNDLHRNYNYYPCEDNLNWWVNGETNIMKDSGINNGKSLFEVPVGYVKNNLFLRMLIGRKRYSLHHEIMRGSYMKCSEDSVEIRKSRWELIKNYNKNIGWFSLDVYGHVFLKQNLKRLYRIYDCKNRDQYMAVICHPKLMDDAGLINMEGFIRYVMRHNDQFQFVVMKDIADRISKI